MSWPIYSERLLAAQGQTGWHYATVPVGKRAVITDVACGNPEGGDSYVQLVVKGYMCWGNHFLAGQQSEHETVRIVAYGGETIQFYLDRATQSCLISGYLFDDPAGAGAGLDTEYSEPQPAPPPLAVVGDPRG